MIPLLLLPLVLISGGFWACGSAEVVQPEVNRTGKVDICQGPMELIFSISRTSSGATGERISLKNTLSIVSMKNGGKPGTYEWSFPANESWPEIQFLLQNREFVSKYYADVIEIPGELVVEYRCPVPQFNCTITHRWKGETIMLFDGAIQTIRSVTSEYTTKNEDTLMKYIRGLNVTLLTDNAKSIEHRWTEICKKLKDADRPDDNQYNLEDDILEDDIEMDIVQCQMTTQVPLKYHMTVWSAGRDSRAIALSADYYTDIEVASYLPVNRSQILNTTCEITSSSGWTVRLRFSEEMVAASKARQAQKRPLLPVEPHGFMSDEHGPAFVQRTINDSRLTTVTIAITVAAFVALFVVVGLLVHGIVTGRLARMAERLRYSIRYTREDETVSMLGLQENECSDTEENVV
ncbi:m153 protein [Murid betaherpesvirus 1]|uniref:M153 protein n=2 Tax=Murid herpesvirus 1 TaxID=10366 RepID=H2A1K0_MUHV1|nr:m153 [Muromegalovirus WP15B]CCE56818.1 m153 protein [Murid betaherpesvirus 1]CCE57313.1 m153 protein [Murid betaherpesvirus 1]